jgi:hypothetical protein
MPPKAGAKKSAKSDDEPKKKETTKGGKKPAEETTGVDLGSVTNDSASAKTAAINAVRGASQSGTPSEENNNKEPGVSTSELSHHTDGNREAGDSRLNLADNSSGMNLPEYEIKYEEPILPNLIVLEYVYGKLINIFRCFFIRNSYEGGKEKGLFEGYGKATYIGGHSYAVRQSKKITIYQILIHREIGVVE